MTTKYAVIAAHRVEYAVTLMCGALGVSPSGFHAAQRRPPSPRAAADEAVRVACIGNFGRRARASRRSGSHA